MKLKNLIEIKLPRLCLTEISERKYKPIPYVTLNKNTLTKQGQTEWEDILNSNIGRISLSQCSLQIELSGCSIDRLEQFRNVLIGKCDYIHYEHWVTNNNLNYAQGGNESVIIPKDCKTAQLIATYEELLKPKEEHITEYSGDYGQHVYKHKTTMQQINDAYIKALDAIEMSSNEFQSDSRFMSRGEIISRMRDCLLASSVKKGDCVFHVATEPYADEDDFTFRGGYIKSINAEEKTCSVKGDFFTMHDVPLHYVLGLYNSDIKEFHYGYEGVEVLYGEHPALAQQYLTEVKQAWNEAEDFDEEESPSMSM